MIERRKRGKNYRAIEPAPISPREGTGGEGWRASKGTCYSGIFPKLEAGGGVKQDGREWIQDRSTFFSLQFSESAPHLARRGFGRGANA
jgi:hypothetical protein